MGLMGVAAVVVMVMGVVVVVARIGSCMAVWVPFAGVHSARRVRRGVGAKGGVGGRGSRASATRFTGRIFYVVVVKIKVAAKVAVVLGVPLMMEAHGRWRRTSTVVGTRESAGFKGVHPGPRGRFDLDLAGHVVDAAVGCKCGGRLAV